MIRPVIACGRQNLYDASAERGSARKGLLVSSRILVAVSSPWASERLAAPVVDLANRLNASVVVTHVAHVQHEDEHESDAKQRGEESLKLLSEELRDLGIEAEGVMLFSDDVPKAILNTAKAKACTLIVIGAAENHVLKGLFKRILASDVPGAILRQSDVPVLILPTNWRGAI